MNFPTQHLTDAEISRYAADPKAAAPMFLDQESQQRLQTARTQAGIGADTYGDWSLDKSTGLYTNKKTNQQLSQADYNVAVGKAQQQQQTDTAEQTRIQQMASEGLNADGSPIPPKFKSLIGDNGLMDPNYQLQLKTLDPNSLQGYNMLKEIATQQGPSKYAQAANQQVGMNRQNTIDAATQQAAGSAAQTQSALAMRGGVSSGARERTIMGANRDLLTQKQGAYRQGNTNLLDVLKQDEDMKRQALTQFGTAEGQIAQNNLGIQNTATTTNNSNLFNQHNLDQQTEMDKYKAALDKWAAGKQADATAKSGGGGGGK